MGTPFPSFTCAGIPPAAEGITGSVSGQEQFGQRNPSHGDKRLAAIDPIESNTIAECHATQGAMALWVGVLGVTALSCVCTTSYSYQDDPGRRLFLTAAFSQWT